MRYLFADSEPFPRDYDFLATLRGFVQCGARCLAAVTAIEALQKQMADKGAETGRHGHAMDELAAQLDSSIDMAVSSSSEPGLVQEVGEQVREHLARVVQLSKGQADGALHQVRETAQAEVAKQKAVIQDALGVFLLAEHLQVLDSRFRIRLQDGAYRAFAVCELPCGLEVAYRLAADRLDEWQSPRKVRDLVGPMEIQIGMKKKFLKRDLTRELAHVDDHVIVNAELDSERAQVTLKRKPDALMESMTLNMRREDGEVVVEIHRPSAKVDSGESIFPAVASDSSKLRELWEQLERASGRTLDHKVSVSTIRLDREELSDGEAVVEWLHRYVELYAPLVSDISRRSPSPKELSLKLEHEDGRREEIYLKREELAGIVGELSPARLQIFSPLDFFPAVDVELA